MSKKQLLIEIYELSEDIKIMNRLTKDMRKDLKDLKFQYYLLTGEFPE